MQVLNRTVQITLFSIAYNSLSHTLMSQVVKFTVQTPFQLNVMHFQRVKDNVKLHAI